MSAAFNHMPPAGCPANLDTLPTHHAGNDSRAIPACAAVGPHSVRLRQRRRMIPELSHFCRKHVPVRASTVLGALVMCAGFPLALFR